MATEPTLDEEAKAAVEFMEGLLAALGISASVASETLEEDTVEVAVTGEDLGLLVGPKGQTLSAIQDLARTAVQHRLGGRSGRLLVDVAGYRKKRRAALERFARGVAEEVLASGVERELEPMSAADRKVIHDTVNDLAGVRTISEGEDSDRHVVIRLADPAPASASASE